MSQELFRVIFTYDRDHSAKQKSKSEDLLLRCNTANSSKLAGFSSGNIGKQGAKAGALHGNCELALLLCACSANAAGHNAAMFGYKATEQSRIFIIKRNAGVESALGTRKTAFFLCHGYCHKSLHRLSAAKGRAGSSARTVQKRRTFWRSNAGSASKARE
jgi:hypothetical protein